MNTPYNAAESDVAYVTFDNAHQVAVTERLYVGMSDGYVPFKSDEDTFGHDYVSVSDGILALMGV